MYQDHGAFVHGTRQVKTSEDKIITFLIDSQNGVRRILDHSLTPNASAWRTIARGVRGLIEAEKMSFEVMGLNQVRPRLEQTVRNLHPPRACCARCAKEMQGITVVIQDVDQAYEAAQCTEVAGAWATLAQEATRRKGSSSILV